VKNANPLSPRAAAGILALAALCLAGCGESSTQTPAAPAVRTVADYFAIKVGGRTVRIQLAVLPEEQERGLMQRRDLEPDEGMIFVDLAPQKLVFWMRNTPTPLDVGYFTPEGELAEIYPLLPFDERAVASRSSRLQFALEMRQGWYAENGVGPGARLDLRAVAAALAERGFDPKRFGLE
jgi:uncharacterized membrane protein (UPF0127 family)